MKKIACYIYNEMADFEVTLTLHQLRDRDKPVQADILVVSEDGRPKIGCSGLTVTADCSLKDLQDDKALDGLIIPGGYNLHLPPELERLIRILDERKGLLAAICAGPWFLASAGVLRQRNFSTSLTSGFFEESSMPDPFNWGLSAKEDICVDGHVVTARPNAFIELAAEVTALAGLYSDSGAKEGFVEFFRTVRN